MSRIETSETAEALMRSRFEAFARGDATYLLETWHASTRPASLELDEGITWRALQIVEVVAGGPSDTAGVVEFRASFHGLDGPGILHERSSFVREGGRWFYVHGVTGGL
jgi:SEC-C motif-containing protein